jgi:hypothetical protein
MPAWMKNRCLAALAAVGYLLTVSTASLFHDHAGGHGGGCCHGASAADEESADECHASHDHSPRSKSPGSPSPCPSDHGSCSVCQFLGQKPAPTAEVVLASSGTLVQEVSSLPPTRISVGVFSAWHSRGPPVGA